MDPPLSAAKGEEPESPIFALIRHQQALLSADGAVSGYSEASISIY